MARLVVVSNRVGIPDGGARAGGLEVAIRPALKKRGGVWFGWNGKATEAEPGPAKTTERDNVSYVTIGLQKDDYEEFYNGFANRVLWPILHYRLDLAEFTRRDLSGYSGSMNSSPPIWKRYCGPTMSSGYTTII